MSWLFLTAAVGFEVTGTLALRVAATGRRALYTLVIAAYLAAFAFLALTLNAGMPLGIAYGVWAAAGIVLTALFSRLLFHEPLTPLMLGGIALIVGGVLLIELGANTIPR